MRLRRIAKKFFLITIDLFGVNRLLRRKSNSPIVLFWHGVSNHANLDIEGESFPKKLFERQVAFLAKHYEVISLDEFSRRYYERCFTNREVVITFDDGYKDNLTIAAPILKKYGLPFTVFVSAQNVEKQQRFYISIPRLIIIGGQLSEVNIPLMNYKKKLHTDVERKACAHEIEYTIKYYSHSQAKTVAEELIASIGQDKYKELCMKYTNGMLLDWEDVKKLSSDYDCTIGSHCLDHCICHPKQNKEEVKKQIMDSKALIEKRIGLKCSYFAYPNGDFSEYSNELVAENYNLGFSTKDCTVFDKSTNKACVGRIGAPCDMLEFKYFLSKLSLR